MYSQSACRLFILLLLGSLGYLFHFTAVGSFSLIEKADPYPGIVVGGILFYYIIYFMIRVSCIFRDEALVSLHY